MDREFALNAQLALPRGHRVEVTEGVDPVSGEAVLLAIADLDTGIRYRRPEEVRGVGRRWVARVVGCTVTIGGPGARTVITLDPESGEGAPADSALRGADAAVDAAKAEADRWGGTDRPERPPTERFW